MIKKKENVKKTVKANNVKVRKTSIRTTLFAGFFIPVFLLVLLGVVSYSTASKTILAKYEESSLNTVEAVSLYAGILTDGVSSRSLEQVNGVDMKTYDGQYSDNTDPAWLEYFGNAKAKILQMYNSTSDNVNVSAWGDLIIYTCHTA